LSPNKIEVDRHIEVVMRRSDALPLPPNNVILQLSLRMNVDFFGEGKLSRNEANAVTVACDAHDNQPDALIEILHHIQSELDCVDDEAARLIANRLNLSRAEVHGVRSFYTDFTTTPRSAKMIKLCRAEACQAVGSETLAAKLEASGVATEAVYCLGNCALGPAAMIDGKLIGRADAETLIPIIEGMSDE
jgi:formate dehydrogenase subunit gamma